MSEEEIFDVEALYRSGDAEKVDRHRRQLDDIINADIRLLFTTDDDGRPEILAPEKWPEREGYAVARFTVQPKTGVIQIQLYDRSRALESRARLDALFKPKTEQIDPIIAKLMRMDRHDLHEVIKFLDAHGAGPEEES